MADRCPTKLMGGRPREWRDRPRFVILQSATLTTELRAPRAPVHTLRWRVTVHSRPTVTTSRARAKVGPEDLHQRGVNDSSASVLTAIFALSFRRMTLIALLPFHNMARTTAVRPCGSGGVQRPTRA
uniref:Uncharacterized protein n=1 Tax=Plectus sambesii TaxID=2011161 RepID=A0A914X300_9BILA